MSSQKAVQRSDEVGQTSYREHLLSKSATNKREPSLIEAYNICNCARTKLNQEMKRRDFDLRQMLCHVTLLERIESDLDKEDWTTAPEAMSSHPGIPTHPEPTQHKQRGFGADRADQNEEEDTKDAQRMGHTTSASHERSISFKNNDKERWRYEGEDYYDEGDSDSLSEDEDDAFDFKDDEDDVEHGLVRVVSHSGHPELLETAHDGLLDRTGESKITIQAIEVC